MKKILKFFLIVPILLLSMLTVFACKDDSLKSISLSIECDFVDSSGYSVVKMSNERNIPINITTSPDGYSAEDFTWQSSATNVVTVYKGTYTARGVGKAIITATYKDSDGSTIKGTLKILIEPSTDENRFSQSRYETVYTGSPLQGNYKVEDDKPGNTENTFQYKYLKILEDAQSDDSTGNTDNYVDNIIDAGTYKIECIKNPESQKSEYCETILVVKKATLSLTAKNYQITYSEEFPTDLYNEKNPPNDLLINSQIGESFYGLGKDSTVKIGKFVSTTTATANSDVSSYTTSYYYQFFDIDEAKNYEPIINITAGNLTILKKSIVIVIQNKDLTYGEAITSTDYEIYSYKDYTDKGGDISQISPLKHDAINFKNQINLGTPTCKVDGTVRDKNASGLYDVLLDNEGKVTTYELCHDSSKVTSNNLTVKVKINGVVKVSPRTIVALPTAGQQKIYGEVDPTNIAYSVTDGSFVHGDSINKFLSIDYGEGANKDSTKISIGKYFYKLDEKANTNYEISLNELAIKDPIEENNEGKVRFEIVKCPIVIKTKSDVRNYVTASTLSSHTISYYNYIASNNKAADYVLEIESITVNGEEITTKETGKPNENCLNNAFLTNGTILLKDSSKFKFEVQVSLVEFDKDGNLKEEVDKESGIDFAKYFTSYRIELDSINNKGKISFESGDGGNYDISFETVYLCLNKVDVKIIPTMTPAKTTKVYDATDALPEGFTADFTVECEEENFNITNAVVSYELLTLNESAKDVGKYKIVLTNNIVYNDGMEYYDIVLDDSKEYFYEITPMNLQISPLAGQTKVYASADPEFAFEQITDFPTGESASLSHTGYLVREAGENVGEYHYSVGTVYYNDNYTVSLKDNLQTFTITPRNLTVKPLSYTTTYGDDYPTVLDKVYEIDGGYDPTLISSPVFSGSLAVAGTKTGDYFRVKYADDKTTIVPYNIVQGSLTCNSNYTIQFDETATLLVNKKKITLDFVPQQIEDKNSVSVPFTMQPAYYNLSALINGSTSELIINTLKDQSSYYEIDSYKLTINYSGNTVTDCYEVSLGRKIVYNIDVKIITVAVVDKATHMTSTINQVYNGIENNDNFVLVCQTAGYKISNESIYTFAYTSEKESKIIPKNVGSYVATLDLETLENSRIVIVNDAENGNLIEETFVFETIGDGTLVNNAVLSVANDGYLNISRANISYVEGKLSFEASIFYGGNKLPNINTNYKDGDGNLKQIFTGVGEDLINLKNFTYTYQDGEEEKEYSLNFSYVQTNYTLYNYEANKNHYINLTIQADNTNYNMLNIDVPLYVSPKNIVITGNDFNTNAGEGDTVYDGTTKAAKFTLTTRDGEKLSTHYDVIYSSLKISASYSKSRSGVVNCYNYDPLEKRPKISEGIKSKSFSEIKNATNSEFKPFEYEGTSYLIFNNTICLILESENSVVPVNAGIYMCIATIEAKPNYTFATQNTSGAETIEQVIGTNKDYYYIYEIQKSGGQVNGKDTVSIDGWKDSFYYTTKFDLTHPNTLPFEYNITPNFKSQVVYSMSEPTEWPQSNVLNIGSYTVNLTVENENYYFTKDLGFQVEQLSASISFPTLDTYIYQGYNKPVTDFLNGIKITEKDKDGNAENSFFYTYGDNNEYIKLEFYDPQMNKMIDDNEKPIIPWDVNKEGEFYTLKVIYGGPDSNYYGEGTFEYSIIKKTYEGDAMFQSVSIIYSPVYTPSQLYSLIYSKMFSIGLESGYEAKIYFGDAVEGDPPLDPNEEKEDITQSWIARVLKYGSINLKLVVTFADGYTDDYEDTAVLTVNKATINQSEFDTSKTSASVVYNGYNVYNYLVYNNVSLNPEDYELNKTTKVTFEDSPYIYYIKKETKSVNIDNQTRLQIVMEVRDNFKSIVFALTYEYQMYNEESDSYIYLNYVPIDPSNNYYKVLYSFSFGVNYQVVSFNINPIQFRINKVDVLYVAADNWTVTYDGNDFVDKFNKEQLIVKNNNYAEGTNMKIDIKRTVAGYFGYVNTRGVCFTIYFTKAKYDNEGKIVDLGEEVEDVINAGTYIVHVSLLYNSNYKLKDYFNHVKFGSNAPISIDDYIASQRDDGNGNFYSAGLTRNLIVNKKQYTINNWSNVLVIDGANIELVNGEMRLVITTDMSFTGFVNGCGALSISIKYRPSGTNIDIGKNNISNNYSFGELEVQDNELENFYAFEIKCDDNHYCSDILFVIRNP